MNFLRADVAIIVDASKLPAQLARANSAVKKSAASMTRAFKKLELMSKRVFSKIAQYARYAALALIAAGVKAIKMAMDVEESENLFEVSMGNMAAAARAWSEELSDVLYLNAFEVRKNIGVFNVMFDSMGLGAKAAYDMAKGLTQLSYDMASFYNLRPEDMFRKLQSAIVGMPRPLQDLGIVVNETAIKQYALNEAMWDGVGVMDNQTKVLARYGLIMKLTNKSQGDLERTLRSSTNVFRSLWTIIQYTATIIGKKFLPQVTKMGLTVRDWLKENQKNIAKWAKTWADELKNIIDWFRRWGTEIETVAKAFGTLIIITKLATWLKGLSVAFLGAAAATGAGTVATLAAVQASRAFAVSLYAQAAALSSNATLQAQASLVAITHAKSMIAVSAATMKATVGTKALFLSISSVVVWVALAYAVYKVIDLYKQYRQVLKDVAKHEEKLTKVIEDAAKRRFEARMKGFKDMWPEVKPWPKDSRDPSKLGTYEEQQNSLKLSKESLQNYKEMADALRFEFDMLGKTNDVRERALAAAKVQKEINNMLDVDRNALMTDYMDLLDKVIAKQNSFGFTLKEWANEQMEWGKRLGEVLVSAFNKASEALTDFVLTGKADFNALADSILRDLTRMIIKAQMAQVLGMVLPGLFGGGGAAAAGGGGSAVNIAGSGFDNPMAVFGAPSGLQHGGTVEKTGWAKVHKGETYSGVDNEVGGGGTVNINVSAIDAAGTYQFLNSNKRAIASLLQGTKASNHPLWR